MTETIDIVKAPKRFGAVVTHLWGGERVTAICGDGLQGGTLYCWTSYLPDGTRLISSGNEFEGTEILHPGFIDMNQAYALHQQRARETEKGLRKARKAVKKRRKAMKDGD